MGLTENSTKLLRWMVSGPEIARLITEFESIQDAIMTKQSKGPDVHNHEQMKSVQERFQMQVRALVHSFETLGNPFKEDSDDLLVLDTKEIASMQVVTTVNGIENPSQEQFQMFLEERLIKHKKEVTDVIKLNKFALFSNPRVTFKREAGSHLPKAELFPVFSVIHFLSSTPRESR